MSTLTIQPVYGGDERTLDQSIQARKDKLSFRRSVRYGWFRKKLLFWRKIDFGEMEPLFPLPLLMVLFFGICLFVVPILAFAEHNLQAAGWTALGMLPFVSVCLARLATLDCGKPAYPEWLEGLLRKRASHHEALRREIAAFDAWAQNAEVHPEFAENLVAQADERRKQLRAAVADELAILDRAVTHHERVKRLVVARKTVDAAFPDPTGRMTRDLACRLSLLHTADTLSDEAAELGMPMDDLHALRQRE